MSLFHKSRKEFPPEIENQPISFKEKKKLLKQQKKALKKKEGAAGFFARFFMILTIIGVLFLLFLGLADVLSVLLGLSMALIWFAVVFIVSVISIGMVWLSETWKSFNASYMSAFEKLISGDSKTINTLKGLIPIIIGVTAALVVCALIFNIINHKKQKSSSSKRKLIVTIIFSILFVISMIIALITFSKIK